MFCIGAVSMGSAGVAQAELIFNDHFTTLVPASTNIPDGGSFTSTAVVGGVITYHVVKSVFTADFAAQIVFFAGLLTQGEIYTTFGTTPGVTYFVTFDAVQFGGPSTHQLDVTAIDGIGTGGTVLADSGAVNEGSSGAFSFAAISANTTLRALGILGASNNSEGTGIEGAPNDSGIGLANLRIEVPEPGSLALLTLGLAGLGGSRRKRA